MSLADQLKAARARLGLTQAEAAKLVGVSPRTIWQWESGRPLSITPEHALRKLQKPEAERQAEGRGFYNSNKLRK